MRKPVLWEIKSKLLLLSILSVFALSLGAVRPGSDVESEIDFQIVVKNSVFAPGTAAHVRLRITNQGEPFYLFRQLSQCSSQLGRCPTLPLVLGFATS